MQAAQKLVRAGAERHDSPLWSAAACCRFPPRELARGISNACTIARQQAGLRQSGSKLPHPKASLRMAAETSFSAACKAPPFLWADAKSSRAEKSGIAPGIFMTNEVAEVSFQVKRCRVASMLPSLSVRQPGWSPAASQTRTCKGGLRCRGLRPWCRCLPSL